jgi:predicted PurR-regulated permease PerM
MHPTEPDRAGATATPAAPTAPRPRNALTPRPLDIAAGWSWRLLVVGAAAAVVFLVLSRMRIIVLPTIVALLATSVLYPPVAWLRARGWPRLLATWTVLLAAIATVAAVVAALSWQVAGEVDELDVSIEQGVTDVEDWLVDGPLGLSRSSVTEAYAQGREWVTSGEGLLSTGIASQAVVAVEVVAGLLLALVLVFFFLKDGERMWQAVTGRLGTRAAAHVDPAGRRAWATLSGYVRGTAVVAAVDAVLIGVAVAVLGVPFALPLAALTFAGAFLPIVGAVVAGSIAVLVALATQGVVTALILLGVVVLVQQVEGDVLQPIVLGRAVRLHPVVILLAVAGGAALGGIVGAFLAVPVVAVASAVMGYVWGEVGPRDATAP